MGMNKHNNNGFHIFGLIVAEVLFTSFIITAIANYESLGYWLVLCTAIISFIALVRVAKRQLPTLLGYSDALTHTVQLQSKAVTKTAKKSFVTIKTTKKSATLRYS